MLFLLLIICVMTTCYILFKLQGSVIIIVQSLGKELHLYGWIMWDVLELSRGYWTAAMTI